MNSGAPHSRPRVTAPPAIALREVHKAFRGAEGRINQAVSNVTLEVPQGCLLGLIGPGAAGKSVLLKLITGLLRPERGTITVDGVDVTAVNELALSKLRLKIGMLFQNNALFDHLTVFDNIAFPLRRLGQLNETEIEARIHERLASVDLPGFHQRMPGGLSGGQKKRIGVARATVTKAPIVIYDEPAAGLDPVTSQKIFELLRREQQLANATVVMVSSDLDRLLTVTDRIAMMYRGQLIFDGTTEDARNASDAHVHQFVHGLTEGPL
jgi:phospholipid/cholesterol/gamma-HCH transport system ATP-binding protein